MDDITFFEFFTQTENLKVLGYFVFFIIGGVVYKYTKLVIDARQKNKRDDHNIHNDFVKALNERIDKLTEDVNKFEMDREKLRDREIERERALAESRAEVKILTERLNHLDEKVSLLREVINAYKHQYGELDGFGHSKQKK